MPRMASIALVLTGLLILLSCGRSTREVRRAPAPMDVPFKWQQEIDSSVTFSDLQAAPADYLGRMVQIAGVLLEAKRTTDQTELEILQLPAKAVGAPTTERLRSEGRFLAVREAFLDPETIPAGTPVTVTGVVKGSVTRALDEREYTYPVVEITHLIDWNFVRRRGPSSIHWMAVERDYLSPESQTLYLDADTISRQRNLVTISQLIDYKVMQGTGAVINPYRFGQLYRFALAPHGFFSTTTRKQFDCATKRVRLLEFTEFSHRMGTGRRNHGYVDQDNWLPVEPESVNHALWELLCGKA